MIHFEIDDSTYVALLSGIAILTMFIFFFMGKNAGSRYEKMRRMEEAKGFEKNLAILESGKNDLLRENDDLRKLHEKYLYFVIRIPETVKQLNSNLTFDETISSIVRFTKDIIDTDCIELYLHNRDARQLELEAAYGSNKKKRIHIPYKEGIIGKAAELRTVITREAQSSAKNPDERIFLGAPILFKDRLIGVLGIGRISNATGDEKRLIAMVADLAGVSLQNCERLSSAQEEANTDALTGLYNRKYFSERTLEESQKAINYGFPISFFMFDIDHFKKYNDGNGHAEGDYLLKELSVLLKEHTRGRDIVARYGGEEFIVMLPNTDKKGAYLYGEKIRKLIETTPFRHREKQPLGFISISGGIATFPFDGDTIDATIKAADAALYKSKETGRNRVNSYEQVRLT